MSETGSRPAYLEEFERKLAAALAQQPDARKTRFGSGRSAGVNIEGPSSRSHGEAITPRSIDAKPPAKAEQPVNETRKNRTQFSSAEPTSVSPQGQSAHDPSKAPTAGGTADVHATRPAGRLSETSSAGRAVESPTGPSESSATHEAPPAVIQPSPRGDGNGPAQEWGNKGAWPLVRNRLNRLLLGWSAYFGGTAPGAVDSKARQTVDFEALLADIEAPLPYDGEVAQIVKPANLHAPSLIIKRFSRDWKLMASACTLVSLAIVGAVKLPHRVLAVPNTPPQADEPSVRETMTRDNSAEAVLKDSAFEASSAAEDRLGADSAGVVATANAPKANDSPRTEASQATIGLANGAASGSTPEAYDPTGPASPLATPAKPSGLKPALAVSGTATSSLAPPGQSSNLNPAPTVSPQPASTPTSVTFPNEGSPADRAPRLSAKPARNVHGVGTAKLSAASRDAPRKVVGKPSIGASVTKNDATSTPAVAEKSDQPLPVETATHPNPEKGAIASNVVQSHSPPVVDPGASAQQPLNHPAHASGRGGVLAQYAVDGSDQPTFDRLRHAIGDIFSTGAAPASDPPQRGD